MDCEVVLAPAELAMGAILGVSRQIGAIRAGKPDQHGLDPANGWSAHIEGALGEMAVARALGVYFLPTIGTYKAGGDIGALQVRTRSRHNYDLIVRPGDRDGDVFILVTGVAPRYLVRGWCIGAEAKKERYRQVYGGRPPAFFVPAGDLLPLDDLREVIRDAGHDMA